MIATETLTAPAFQAEAPEDTLARLVALANAGRSERHIKLNATFIAGAGETAPQPDRQPLVTRDFSNDEGTMERVLVGLRRLPEEWPMIQSRVQAPSARAVSPAATPTTPSIEVKPRYFEEPQPAEDRSERRLRAAGFNSGEGIAMSARLVGQLAMNPNGKYRGLRQHPERLSTRVGAVGRRIGGMALKLAGTSAAIFIGIDTVLAQLQR